MGKCEICGKETKESPCKECKRKIKCAENLETLLQNIDLKIHFRKDGLNLINIKNPQTFIFCLKDNDLINEVSEKEFYLKDEIALNNFFKEIKLKKTVKEIIDNRSNPKLQITCKHCGEVFPIFKVKRNSEYCRKCNDLIKTNKHLDEFLEHVKPNEKFKTSHLNINNIDAKIYQLIDKDLISQQDSDTYSLIEENINKFKKENGFEISTTTPKRKTCTKCHKTKPITQFKPNSDICKQCELTSTPPSKTCTTCHKTKPISQFEPYSNVCKLCESEKNDVECEICGNLSSKTPCHECEKKIKCARNLEKLLRNVDPGIHFNRSGLKSINLNSDVFINTLKENDLIRQVNDDEFYLINKRNLNIFFAKVKLYKSVDNILRTRPTPKLQKKCKKCGKTLPIFEFKHSKNVCKQCELKPTPTPSKTCIKCHKTKPITQFKPNSDICKQCEPKPTPTTSKTCIKCHKTKPITQFKQNSNICKQCEITTTTNTSKTCTQCHKTKPTTQFRQNSDICKLCENKPIKCKICGKLTNTSVCPECKDKRNAARYLEKIILEVDEGISFKLYDLKRYVGPVKNDILDLLLNNGLIKEDDSNSFYHLTSEIKINEFLKEISYPKTVKTIKKERTDKQPNLQKICEKCGETKSIYKFKNYFGYCADCEDVINANSILYEILRLVEFGEQFKIHELNLKNIEKTLYYLNKFKLINDCGNGIYLLDNDNIQRFIIDNDSSIKLYYCDTCHNLSIRKTCKSCSEKLRLAKNLETLLYDVNPEITFKKESLSKFNIGITLQELVDAMLIKEIDENTYATQSNEHLDEFLKSIPYEKTITEIIDSRNSEARLQKVCEVCGEIHPLHEIKLDKCYQCIEKINALESLFELLDYVNPGESFKEYIIPILNIYSFLEKLKEHSLIRQINQYTYEVINENQLKKLLTKYTPDLKLQTCEICGKTSKNNICPHCNDKIETSNILEKLLMHVNPGIPFLKDNLSLIPINKLEFAKLIEYNLVEAKSANEYILINEESLNKFFRELKLNNKVVIILMKRHLNEIKLQKKCPQCEKIYGIHEIDESTGLCSECVKKNKTSKILLEILKFTQPESKIKRGHVLFKSSNINYLIKYNLVKEINGEFYLTEDKQIVKFIKENSPSFKFNKCEKCGVETTQQLCQDCLNKLKISKFLDKIICEIDCDIAFKKENLIRITPNDDFDNLFNQLLSDEIILKEDENYLLTNKTNIDKYFKLNRYEKTFNEIINSRSKNQPTLQKNCIYCQKVKPIHDIEENGICKSCMNNYELVKIILQILSFKKLDERFKLDSVKIFNIKNNIQLLIDNNLIIYHETDDTYELSDKKILREFIKKNSINILKLTDILIDLADNTPINKISHRHHISLEELKIWYELGKEKDEEFIEFFNLYRDQEVCSKLNPDEKRMVKFVTEYYKNNDQILSKIFSGITDESIDYYCENKIPGYEKEIDYFIENEKKS